MLGGAFEATAAVINKDSYKRYINSLKPLNILNIALCLLSAGVFTGSLICGNKKALTITSLLAMLGTYIPVIYNFTKFMSELPLGGSQSGKENK